MVLSFIPFYVGLDSLGEKHSTFSMAEFFINCTITTFLEQDVTMTCIFKGNCKGDFRLETELVNIKSGTACLL